MSKITTKNLHYRTSPPPFLARLKAGHAAQDGRSEVQSARPKKGRSKAEEHEDDPVVFDEGTGESLTKGEWESREREKEKEKERKEEEENGKGGLADVVEGGRGGKENFAGIGSGKKRKLGKVVGVEEGGDGRAERIPEGKKANRWKGAMKKVKLSFGDDE